ncbi:peptidylprolyl isomerase [Chitinophaga pendula]|uniref:peptidylprolyl isomerase n=1 Tax=Chitinophaga TaxID=79328 RepID=UPI000BB01071|nr:MULTISPECIES: peptidylprolyl isomerase [Chitinophaga]ASZ13020.1 peptidylprolyl isomerase [Chitinophaga sp. MD30]UCJ09349.1 peptidylprolyl isomerase [Chitinophaga pendula]
MKKYSLLCLLLLSVASIHAQSTKVKFNTYYGSFIVTLYDQTPKHRDMFLAEIKKGTYTGALFNRIVKDFVVQGGVHDDTVVLQQKQHPERTIPRLPGEFNPDIFHKKGTLGAGRDDNPQQASFLDQIYFVIGRKYTETQLDSLEQQKHIKIPASHRTFYKTNGGLPSLDGRYTIFGEITTGYQVIEKINQLPTDNKEYPLKQVPFSVIIL